MVKYEVNFKGKLAGGSGFMQFVLRRVFRSTRVQLGSRVSRGEKWDFGATREPEQVQFLVNKVVATFIA